MADSSTERRFTTPLYDDDALAAARQAPSMPPLDLLEARLARLRAAMAASSPAIEALMVMGAENKGWLSGFTTGAFLAPGGVIVVTAEQSTFVTSHVDYEECQQALTHMRVVPYESETEELADRVVAVIAALGVSRIWIEAPHTSVAEATRYARMLQTRSITLEHAPTVIAPLRAAKDVWEAEQLRLANAATARAFAEVLPLLRPGITEWEIAAELDYRLRREGHGSARNAFQSIVASGPNSAFPHASVSQRALEHGDFLTFDFGATWNGYCADCTRTVVIGSASERQRALYAAVLASQEASIAAIHTDGACDAIDAVARTSLFEAGYGDFIAHSLGHGLGVEVHEAPRLAPRSSERLLPGSIVTVEPGLYIPGFGGVRIEDNILIHADGIENLTTTPKALLEL